jgi:hypothetical protein
MTLSLEFVVGLIQVLHNIIDVGIKPAQTQIQFAAFYLFDQCIPVSDTPVFPGINATVVAFHALLVMQFLTVLGVGESVAACCH